MESLVEQRLDEIIKMLDSLRTRSAKWLTIEMLSYYIGLSKATIYQYVSKNRIPYHKIPGSSRLLFLRVEIDEWIIKGGGVHESIAKEQKYAKKFVDDLFEKLQ